MASLQQEPTGVYHVVVRINGKRYKRSLGTKTESKAISRRDEIAEMISLINRGKIEIPQDVSAIEFVLADGKPPEPKPTSTGQKEQESLKSLFNKFFKAIPDGSVEANTLKMLHIHERHLLRILKPQFDVASLTGQHLQDYISKRAKEKTQYFVDRNADKKERKIVSATTIRKEIGTLGEVWRWAASIPIVYGAFPNRGLRYPKTDEKPPFQTRKEIERQIEFGKLTSCEADELWECLYFQKDEVALLLDHVKKSSRSAFIHPMFAMAAYTGARRSELIRSRKIDFDFDQNVVTIRERKRVKGQRSTRRVPLTNQLRTIMQDWFENGHPGCVSTFAQRKGKVVEPITPDQAQSHFRQTVDGSKWGVIKGWHCLRHSFISQLACAGVDQRIIDEFVGHSTEEMRRRYRHLFPDVKQAAIDKVFD